MRVSPHLLFACVLAATGPACARCLAQELTTGAVGGEVRDVQNAVVADARVTLLRQGIPASRMTQTDEGGEFRLDALQPGEYLLVCEHSGFATARVATVTVRMGQVARLALVLRPSSVAQVVTVEADAAERPSLSDSPVNGDLTPQEMSSLPLDGRRFQQFALFTPLTNLADDGTTLSNAPNGSTADPLVPQADDANSGDVAQTATRSLDPSQGSFTQDGATAQRGYDGAPRGGANVPFNIPLEAVREFQVRAVGTGSPLGRDAAGAVNAVTRRAEDALHGSAFFLLRNSAADAAEPFAIATRFNGGSPISASVKPRDQRSQFGGSLGRLLPHTGNRLYAFGAAEVQRRSFPGISSPDNPAFFTLTPMQTALLGNRGVTVAATARGLAFLDSLGGEVPRRSTTLAVTPRLDVVTSKASTFLATYTGVRHDAPSGLRDGAVIPRARDSFATLNITADTLHLQQSAGLGRRWVVQGRATAAAT